MGFCASMAGRCQLRHLFAISFSLGLTNIAELLQLILYICFSISSGFGRTFFKSHACTKPCSLAASFWDNELPLSILIFNVSRMRILLFFLSICFSTSCISQTSLKLDYGLFGISFYPIKCVDTLIFPINTGDFVNCKAKIYLEDCNGQSKLEVLDVKNKIRVVGFYSSSIDTLIKYNNAKVMGKPLGQYNYLVRTLKYFSPLQTGRWIFFDKNGKEIYKTEYHFDRQL